MKEARHRHILDILEQETVGSQGELVQALAGRGQDVNQATISRDLRELGVMRVPDGGGKYRYVAPKGARAPADPWRQLARRFEEFVTCVDGNELLVVVKTRPGCAHAVAIDLDALDEPDVVGCVAGDDTVLVVPRTRQARKRLQERFANLARPSAGGRDRAR